MRYWNPNLRTIYCRLIPRMVSAVAAAIDDEHAKARASGIALQWEFVVSLTVVEIYNERIRYVDSQTWNESQSVYQPSIDDPSARPSRSETVKTKLHKSIAKFSCRTSDLYMFSLFVFSDPVLKLYEPCMIWTGLQIWELSRSTVIALVLIVKLFPSPLNIKTVDDGFVYSDLLDQKNDNLSVVETAQGTWIGGATEVIPVESRNRIWSVLTWRKSDYTRKQMDYSSWQTCFGYTGKWQVHACNREVRIAQAFFTIATVPTEMLINALGNPWWSRASVVHWGSLQARFRKYGLRAGQLLEPKVTIPQRMPLAIH